MGMHTVVSVFRYAGEKLQRRGDIVCLFGLGLYVRVNNFSVMSGQSQRFLGITSTYLGGKCILLKDITRRPE